MSERQPFDPSRIKVPPTERLASAGSATLSPREVNELIRGAISRHIPATLHVLGQIGDFSRPQSGHLYFSLKDGTSELRCVMWRSSAAKTRFSPEPGMEVIATGGLDVYTPRGTYQLIVRKLEPRGIGALEVAFRQLKDRLEREGLFDLSRKKSLPRIPKRIAVVTSPSGAAIRDILHTLTRRYPALDVFVYPVRVQGEGAAAEISEAIDLINARATQLDGIDVMIVGRGGGSLEDLWPFNEEIVARAIAASNIPIVSAVGHEIDVSISDLVADVRAATPTAAAELIAPNQSDLQSILDRQISRAARHAIHCVQILWHRLQTALASDWLARPLNRIRERAQWFDEREHRIRLGVFQLLHAAREQLVGCERAIERLGAGAQFARIGGRLELKMFRLSEVFKRELLSAERQLHGEFARLQRRLPLDRLARGDEHLHQAQKRLTHAVQAQLMHQRRMIEARLEAVQACDPKRVLRRGYSITREARTRRVIKSVREIKDKIRIITELSDGEFWGTADDPRQPNLFD